MKTYSNPEIHITLFDKEPIEKTATQILADWQQRQGIEGATKHRATVKFEDMTTAKFEY